ncbi:Rer1 family [Babesia microti strain RI]|uniref:Protein RER1 n=1 Tax=Babesia microti (strain RI) TaxID=1133968 RepID=I7IS31_BABMR|nr:Rer1 family [Babesia microti strain RI]CCF75271.1 Rer1 family [Babesia microti strain RI]|eukprot:XP_012649679.1 Rer1 family [Babesia microti strain RI]
MGGMFFGLENNPQVRVLLDKTPYYIKTRWLYFAFILFIFWFRVIKNASHFVIVYMHSVFILSLLLQFLTPLNFEELCERHSSTKSGLILPVTYEDVTEFEANSNNFELPTSGNNSNSGNDEFKPFLRKMNEFHFWLYGTHATHLAIFTTFFSAFDLPVFWPLLVLYFVCLFISTMKNQISNMIKYKYIPITLSKQSYSNDRSRTMRI